VEDSALQASPGGGGRVLGTANSKAALEPSAAVDQTLKSNDALTYNFKNTLILIEKNPYFHHLSSILTVWAMYSADIRLCTNKSQMPNADVTFDVICTITFLIWVFEICSSM
jgi:hypothetical protein